MAKTSGAIGRGAEAASQHKESAHPHALEGALQAQQEELCDHVRQQCMDRLVSGMQGLRLVTDADVRAYADDVLSDRALALGGLVEADKKIDALRQTCSMWIPALLSDARQLESSFATDLREAVNEGALSEQAAEQWFARLSPLLYKDKKEFIRRRFPEYRSNWLGVARRRKHLLNHPRLETLSSADVSGLETFLDEKRFAQLHYPERKDLVGSMDAILKALDRDMLSAYQSAKARLTAFTVAPSSLHPSKVGVWLQRAFRKAKTPEDVATFMADVVEPYAANWEAARQAFDEVDDAMAREGMPKGFPRKTPEGFLLLSYDERQAYIASAQLALKVQREHAVPERREFARLQGLKSLVAQALARGDTDACLLYLQQIRTIDPDDADLDALADAVHDRRSSQLEAKAADEATAELRDTLAQLRHTALISYYGKALAAGATVFGVFSRAVERRLIAHAKREADQKTETVEVEVRQSAPQRSEPEAVVADATTEEAAGDAYRAVAVGESGDAALDQSTMHKLEEDKEAGLVLTVDGKPISYALQFEAARAHPWLIHNLAILEASGRKFVA